MEKLYRWLYPMRIVLITARHKEKRNVMPAAWCFPLSMDPPLFGVSVSKKRYTYSLIEKGKAFVINIPGKDLVEVINKTGESHGNEVDKFQAYSIKYEESPRTGIPIIKGINAYIECRVERIIEIGDHPLIIGKAIHFERLKEEKGIYQLPGKREYIFI